MNLPSRFPRRAARIYTLVLHCYPAGYQQAFGAQMLRTFSDCYMDMQQEQGQVSLIFWIHTLGDEIAGIIREWIAFFIEGEANMQGSPSSWIQWVTGIIAGLILVAAFILLGLTAGQGLVLGPVGLFLLLLVVLPALGVVLVGRGVVFMHRQFSGVLGVLVNRWRTAAGLFGAILLPLATYFGIFLLSPATQACLGKVIAPSSPSARLITAQDYFHQGDYEYDQGRCSQAIADYTQAITLDPQVAEVYNNRAYTYMALDQYDKALPDLDQAIAIRPDYINALMNRGDIYNYYYAVNHDRAIADYDRVMAIDPQNQQHTQVNGHMAYACFFRGDFRPMMTLPDKTGPDCQSRSQP